MAVISEQAWVIRSGCFGTCEVYVDIIGVSARRTLNENASIGRVVCMRFGIDEGTL